jgi:DUF2075 family protein/DNA replication protein DnaC
MIVYSEKKSKFHDDIFSNNISGIILDKYESATGGRVGESELLSWSNSLQYMDRVLNDSVIPDEAGISIEYHIPRTTKRIDFIITGQDTQMSDSAIIIELKQWSSAKLTNKDAIVKTRFRHGEVETAHPSYQAWSYKMLLEDFNETVDKEDIKLYPCAYLHNYEVDDVIQNNFYEDHIKNAPLFLKDDTRKLREFIKQHIKHGDRNEIMYRIDHGRIRPSKSLADKLSSMLSGNKEFIMVDDQKVVYENARNLFPQTDNQTGKNVLIVEGGPGTGKTVVAINLLVNALENQLIPQYVTRNSAPRLVYEQKLTGSFKKSHISNLFSSSGTFHSVEPNMFDVLIVDEAHRLNAKSGIFKHLGENQIKEIIKASKTSIFFIDEDQRVTIDDIGDKQEIWNHAKSLGANVVELKLESQFRCNGSNGYLAWLDQVLQIRKTANTIIQDIEYDFQVFDDPQKLHDVITERNRLNNKARVLAGYCWKWVSKRQPLLKDIKIGNYEATWNLDEDGQAWIIQPDSVSEVGCIHTSQGLEVDYVGVIIGPDLIVRDGKIVTVPEARASTDRSIRGWKKQIKEGDEKEVRERLDLIIKNTYRTLMTRGQKGCYVFSSDQETNEYFKEKLNIT